MPTAGCMTLIKMPQHRVTGAEVDAMLNRAKVVFYLILNRKEYLGTLHAEI